MKKAKYLLIAVLLVSMTVAQQVSKIDNQIPSEVQKIIDETMSGQNLLSNFNYNKIGFGLDSSVKLSDLKAGDPVQCYYIHKDSLKKMDENVPVSSFAKVPDIWVVPVLINGKCFTTFEVGKTKKNPQWHATIFHGGHKGRNDDWQKVREAWPKSAGYNPIIIYLTLRYKCYHVPEKDDFNLTPLFRPSFDSLARSADTSYGILMSSKKTLKYVNAHWPAEQNGGSK
jgi:hypothetical protein